MVTSSPSPASVRIAVMNDYEVVLQGVRMMLAPWSSRVEVVELDARATPRQRVDIVLFDMFGRDRSAALSLRAQLKDSGVDKIVVYAWHFTREFAQALLQSGVSGVVSKRLPAARLVEALEQVAAGQMVIAAPDWGVANHDVPPSSAAAANDSDWPGREYGLTMREAEMIALVTLGLTNSEIARRLYISGNTVKTYIRAAYRKIGVTHRSQAVAWGLRHNITPQTVRETLQTG